MKIYSNEFGHAIKMAAMPIYGKTLKIFFSRTNRPMTLKLICRIVYGSTTRVVLIMTFGGP